MRASPRRVDAGAWSPRRRRSVASRVGRRRDGLPARGWNARVGPAALAPREDGRCEDERRDGGARQPGSSGGGHEEESAQEGGAMGRGGRELAAQARSRLTA